MRYDTNGTLRSLAMLVRISVRSEKWLVPFSFASAFSRSAAGWVSTIKSRS